jgi:hypothetical protein
VSNSTFLNFERRSDCHHLFDYAIISTAAGNFKKCESVPYSYEEFYTFLCRAASGDSCEKHIREATESCGRQAELCSELPHGQALNSLNKKLSIPEVSERVVRDLVELQRFVQTKQANKQASRFRAEV